MQIILIILGLVLILFNIRFISDGDSTVLKKKLERTGIVSTKRREAIKQDSNGENDSFSGILENEKLSITEVDLMIGEVRREFSETLIELQREIIALSDKIDLLTEAQSSEEIVDTIDITEADLDEVVSANSEYKKEENTIYEAYDNLDTIEIENKSFSKSEQVGILLKKGYSIDEICEKLQIGRGEVLLIKKLYQS